MNFFRDDPKIRFAGTSGDSGYLSEIPLFNKHNVLVQPVVPKDRRSDLANYSAHTNR
jgi:hypothetical protein